jgi:hypothetical protein
MKMKKKRGIPQKANVEAKITGNGAQGRRSFTDIQVQVDRLFQLRGKLLPRTAGYVPLVEVV